MPGATAPLHQLDSMLPQLSPSNEHRRLLSYHVTCSTKPAVLIPRSVKNAHEQLTGYLSQLMPFVYVAFFGLAGASLKLVSQSIP